MRRYGVGNISLSLLSLNLVYKLLRQDGATSDDARDRDGPVV